MPSPLVLLATAQVWSFATGAAPTVSVANILGSIEVMAGRTGEVRVEARLGKGAERGWQVEAAALDPQRIAARAVCRGERAGLRWCPRVRVDWVLHVPPGSALDLAGVESPIAVTGITGAQRIGTVRGDVRVEGAVAEVEAVTQDGLVDVRRAEPPGRWLRSLLRRVFQL